MPEDCLFCGIVAGSVPSETIDSDERTLAFMDISPATPGHALVVPRAHSADLLDFFLPSPVSRWWGPAVRAAREQIYPGAVIWNVALGWLGLLLGGIGAIALRRQSWRWSLLLLAALLLAMGPTLRVAGYETGLPLPFALIRDLPGIRSGQRPNHMAVIASLMLAILAAYGVLWATRRLPARGAWIC